MMERSAEIYQDLDRILVTSDEIHEKVRELGRKIGEDYKGKSPVMICILKGACIFFSDLIREIPLPLTTDFMAISSYGSATKTSGVVRILKDLDKDILGKDVIIVEDIIDSGNTIEALTKIVKDEGAASVKVCTMLFKPACYKKNIKIDYSALSIPDNFIVGFGLDYNELGRNYMDIYVLDETK